MSNTNTTTGAEQMNTTTYNYVAIDAGGNIITREGLTAEQLRVHKGNLLVAGYRMTVVEVAA
jgi:hypothetical protein